MDDLVLEIVAKTILSVAVLGAVIANKKREQKMTHNFVSNITPAPGPNPYMQVCNCGYKMPWISMLHDGEHTVIGGGPTNTILNKLIGFSNHLGELISK